MWQGTDGLWRASVFNLAYAVIKEFGPIQSAMECAGLVEDFLKPQEAAS